MRFGRIRERVWGESSYLQQSLVSYIQPIKAVIEAEVAEANREFEKESWNTVRDAEVITYRSMTEQVHVLCSKKLLWTVVNNVMRNVRHAFQLQPEELPGTRKALVTVYLVDERGVEVELADYRISSSDDFTPKFVVLEVRPLAGRLGNISEQSTLAGQRAALVKFGGRLEICEGPNGQGVVTRVFCRFRRAPKRLCLGGGS
jgi:hypothetical protein